MISRAVPRVSATRVRPAGHFHDRPIRVHEDPIVAPVGIGLEETAIVLQERGRTVAGPAGAEVVDEEHGLLRRLQFDPVLDAGQGQLEGADLESFVPDGQGVTVKVEGLDPIPAAVEEEEEMAGQEVLPEAFLNQPRKAVETLAQVG